MGLSMCICSLFMWGRQWFIIFVCWSFFCFGLLLVKHFRWCSLLGRFVVCGAKGCLYSAWILRRDSQGILDCGGFPTFVWAEGMYGMNMYMLRVCMG